MELKWSFSQTQRIPIGIVLFYLWVIYSTTLQPDIWTRLEADRDEWMREAHSGSDGDHVQLHSFPFYPSRSLPRAFSLHPSVLILSFFFLVTSCTPFCQYFYPRLFTLLSVDAWRLSTCTVTIGFYTNRARFYRAGFWKFWILCEIYTRMVQKSF